jgi:hypothetical protein
MPFRFYLFYRVSEIFKTCDVCLSVRHILNRVLAIFVVMPTRWFSRIRFSLSHSKAITLKIVNALLDGEGGT